jgi:hypothetical protein
MKNATIRCRAVFPLLGLFLLLIVPGAVEAAAPDLTTTDLSTIDRTYTYNLGPTGMRGWIYIDRNNVGDYGTMTAQQPWQILVTTVGASTPASGIMASNDVILGASAGSGAVPFFTNDSRKCLGWAIGAAEAGNGILKLKRWRAGTTSDVQIELQVMGAYSATAPFNCPKSALILSNALSKIASKSFNAGEPGDPVLGLALLASGNPAYLPKVQAYARSIAPSSLALNPNACNTWSWGYKSVFLSEYYLLTGDTNVLSGIKKYTIALAQAQSLYGTYGHGGAEQHADGSFHGSISWYGPVNAAGLVANMGIVLGRKCLVASATTLDPEIDPAIDRASRFFGYYVSKGSIPYGEHEPWSGGHASNGKDQMAALMFALQGNRPVETEYFTRMSVAGYNGREYGHTGQGFSYLWGALGANVGGTNAVASHLAQVRWHLDLSRRSDGTFVYDGGEQYGCSAVSDYWGSATYASIDPTASYVLTYALPKQQLYITGKNANPDRYLNSEAVSNAIWVGMFNQVCAGYDTNQLVSAMGEYDPGVRYWAAATIGAKANVSVPMLMGMASSTNVLWREAACQALGVKQDTSALTLLGQRLTDTNIWVRSKASKALQNFGSAASPQLTTMLNAFITNATDPHVIVWEDPIQIANGYLADELFNTLGASTINAPTNLLYPALRAGLQQPDGMALGYLSDFVGNRLTLTHIQAVASSLVSAIAVRSPADRMFSDTIRYVGLNTLGKYLIDEGIPLCLLVKEQTWHGDNWEPFDTLINNYRGAAKDALSTLYKWQAHIPLFAADPSIGGCCPGRLPTITNKIAAAIMAIETDPSPPTLVRFKKLTMAKASPAAITIPTTSTGLSSVAAPDLDGGVPAFSWSKISGAGTVSFTPNGTTASSNTVASFNSFGTYVLRVSAFDTSILNSNIWTTYNLGYHDFQTYTNVLGAVYSNVTVSVMVATNRAPIPQNQSLTTAMAAPLAITLAATDPNGDVLSYSVVTPPAQGTLSGSPPDVVYSPATNYTGFDSFTFKANDGQVDSSMATITIDVGASGNRRPVAANQSVTTAQNTATPIALAGTDPDNNPLAYAITTFPAQGTLSGVPPNMTYVPATNFPGGNLNGADSFTFAVNDGPLTSAVATVSITVTPPGPVVGNTGPATNLAAGVAQLGGTLTNAPADVRIYWGVTDGGTHPPNWATTILLTNTTQSPYSSNVSNLLYGVKYYYRCYASNLYGTAWAPATTNFTTQRPPNPTPQLVNVNIDSTPETGLVGPAGGANSTWNQFGKDYGLGTVHEASLLDSLGGSTAIGFTFQSTGNPDGWGAPVLTMLQNGGYNGNTRITGGSSYLFEVNGLTSGRTYDLYIGSWYDNEQGSKGAFVTSNTTTNGLTQSLDNGWTASGWSKNSSTWAQGTNYVAFRSVVASRSGKISITMTADPGTGSRNPKLMLSGFQLLNLTPLLPALSLTNSPATAVTAASAVLNATLRCTGTVYQVSAYWNTVNGGTNATTWTHSAYVGAWTNLASTNLSYTALGLTASSTYFFTFRATNAAEVLWATNELSFTTLPPPGTPMAVHNAAGATNLAAGVVQLRGTLVSANPATVRLYWGTGDGGTNGPWANTNVLTNVPNGPFASTISNLYYGLAYCYRCYASNQTESAWAPATDRFTTLRPSQTPFPVTNGLALWLDASQLTGLADGQQVNTWTDLSGLGNHAVRQSGSSSGYPQYVTSQLNGKQVVRFNSANGNTGDCFKFNRISTIRTVFWLLKEDAGTSDGHFLLGDDSNYDFHRASANGPLWEVANGWSSVNIRNGTTKLMGTVVNGTTTALPASQFQLISLVTTGNVQANQITQDRVYHGSWQGDIAEILIYTNALSTDDEALVGGYLASKYGLSTPYPASTPTAFWLSNSPATHVASFSAVLNSTLACAGAVYRVSAFWNTVNGGTNTALWTNSAFVGSWTNLASTNLSFTATGLSPSKLYYFTFGATNAVDTLWATNVRSFTTLTPPPLPALPGRAITVEGGVPTFTFATASGFNYRLAYKNALADTLWLPVIAPPDFPPPNGWSATSTGAPMSLRDTNTVGQTQRFYRLEAANP